MEQVAQDARQANQTLGQELRSLLAAILKMKQEQQANKSNEDRPTLLVVSGPGDLKPVFIDCRRDGVIILPTKRLIPTDEIENSKAIGNLIDRVGKAKGWCVQLLVRQGGVKSFDKVYFRVALAGVSYGLHPVQTDKDFDVGNNPVPAWLKE